MSKVHIKRDEILRLFDTKQESNEGLATAFSLLAGEEMGIALLEHYLKHQGILVKVLPDYPKTGQSKGPRLDGWLVIDSELAQVEVKNWGANAIGGRAYSGNALHGWQQFLHWFSKPEKNQKVNRLQKVLYPMKAPAPYAMDGAKLAIACIWPVMHISEGTNSYFSVNVRTQLPPLEFETPFNELHVFSMSAYLHSLQDDVLELDMPRTYARLKKMATILGLDGKALNIAK